MNSEPMSRDLWEKQLRRAALAVCDLYNPSIALSLLKGSPDERFKDCVDNLRELAWKAGHRTTFAEESDRTED